MSRRGRQKASGIQLFPFLAVLICTMGSLIVLLVLMVQHSTVDAATREAAERPTRTAADEDRERAEREAVEDEQWRQQMLEQQRAEKAEELASKRLKLSHLEDHIRRLREQAQGLMQRAGQLDQGQAASEQDLAKARAELDRLRREIAAKQKELDEARNKQSKEQWYALIPYDGPNGTRRRPIYIECTSRGVVLQPEGILFTTDDFSGPMGPGNPLDSALRATREYLAKAGPGQQGEPYPLLVVRPSGIVAYGAARAAMKSWDEEFGYELVAEDKPLAFGSADPALQQVLGQTVGAARQKQAIMMAAMPRRFGEEESLTSFAPEDQPDYQEAVASAGGRGIGGGRGVSGGQGGDGFGRGQAAGTGMGGTGRSGAVRAVSAPSGGAGGGSSGQGGASGGGSGGAASGQIAGPALGSPGGGASGASGGGSAPTSGMNGGMNSVTAGNPGAAMMANGSRNGSSANGSPDGQRGDQPGAAQGSSAAGGSPSGSSGSPSSGSSAQKSSGGSSGSRSSMSSAGKGSNWGLPDARNQATAITRPIRVACLSDRIVILPERGDSRAPQVINISPQLTYAEVDAFAAGIRRHMNSWGLAVANGYWKPVLRCEVATEAEQQFADLQAALQGSGFDVQRKAP